MLGELSAETLISGAVWAETAQTPVQGIATSGRQPSVHEWAICNPPTSYARTPTGTTPPLRASEQRPKARQPHLDPVREASHAEREELLSSFGKYGAIHHHYGLSSPAEGISESGGALPTSAHHWCAFVSLL